MRPTVVVGVAALAIAIVLAGTVASAEGVEPTTYRSLQEARFRPVILPTDTGIDVPLALVDMRLEGPRAKASNTPRLLPDAIVPESLATPGPGATPGQGATPGKGATPGQGATSDPTSPPVVAGAVEGVVASGWQHDPEVSWYGPGFYGHRTACGYALTQSLIGVAHRSLPCGTRIVFRYGGKIVVAPVVDRGPYVPGRQWDMTAGLAIALDHLFTGSLDWRLE